MQKATPTKVAVAVPPAAAAVPVGPGGEKRDATFLAIQRIQREREERRRSQENMKRKKDEEMARIEESGMPAGDLDFVRMIANYRSTVGQPRPHNKEKDHDICVVVRKRPINKRELANRDWDSVTCVNPRVIVHAPKLKVDGITKYLDNLAFAFDHSFDESSTTEDLYRYTVMPLVQYAFERKGRGTCIAYGQTGSGKTFTITGLHKLVATDVFRLLAGAGLKGYSVHVSFLEIYGARCVDLLHGRNKVTILEDAKQRVVCAGLEEEEANSPEELLELIAKGNGERATHATEVNSQSSRSHAICEISIRGPAPGSKVHGSISLVDLAGSERAADSRNHNQQRRIESAEINKSLLALKECIRALAMKSSVETAAAGGEFLGQHVHVPFRASKLTLVLRESFTSSQAKVVMVATVSPNASSADHTQNTLRYADRVKEKVATAGDDDDDDGDGDEEGRDGSDEGGDYDDSLPEGSDGSDGDDDDEEHGNSLSEVAALPAAVAGAVKGVKSSASALAIPKANAGAGAGAGAAGGKSSALGPYNQRNLNNGSASASAPSLPMVYQRPRVSPVNLTQSPAEDSYDGGRGDTVDDEEEGARGVPKPGSFVKGPADKGFSAAQNLHGALAGLKSKGVASGSSGSSGPAQAVESDDEDGGRNVSGVKRPLPKGKAAAGGRAAAGEGKESKDGDGDYGDSKDADGDNDILPSNAPAAAPAPAASSSSLAGGFRKLLQRVTGTGSKTTSSPAPAAAALQSSSSPAASTAPPVVTASAAAAAAVDTAAVAAQGSGATPTNDSSGTAASATAAATGSGKNPVSDIRSKLRERGKQAKQQSTLTSSSSSSSTAAAPATATAAAAAPSQIPPRQQAIPTLIPVGKAAAAAGGNNSRASVGGAKQQQQQTVPPPRNNRDDEDARTVGSNDGDGDHNGDDDEDEPLEAVLDRGLKIAPGNKGKKGAVASVAGHGPSSSAVTSTASSSSSKVAQSFLPLPASKFPSSSSPQQHRDLTVAHQMKRREDEEAAAAAATKRTARTSVGGASAAGASAAAPPAASTGTTSRSAPSNNPNARHGEALNAGKGSAAAPVSSSARASLPHKPAVPTQQKRGHGNGIAAGHAVPPIALSAVGAGHGLEAELEEEESPLMQLHETAGHILEEEEHLLQLHLEAIQQTALELKEEGELVKATQAEDESGSPLLDISDYAAKLEKIMVARVQMATRLLKRVRKFRGDLAREEVLSKSIVEEDLRLA